MEGPSDERKDYASDQPREIGDAELDFLAQYTGHQDRSRLRQHVLATWQQAKDDVSVAYSRQVSHWLRIGHCLALGDTSLQVADDHLQHIWSCTYCVLLHALCCEGACN